MNVDSLPVNPNDTKNHSEMKPTLFKNTLVFSVSALSSSFLSAQTVSVPDSSLQVIDLVSMQTVLVNAVNSPTGITTQQNSPSQINSKFNLKNLNTGRDIPILLQELPGVVSSSDAGNGIGYTGIRVRGADATRTNITVNGVPINDAESHGKIGNRKLQTR